jgi:hypothetical protein
VSSLPPHLEAEVARLCDEEMQRMVIADMRRLDERRRLEAALAGSPFPLPPEA